MAQAGILTFKGGQPAVMEINKGQYRCTVESLNEGIWIIDAEGKTIFTNTKLSEILGYSKNEMIGKPLFLFMDEESRILAAINLKFDHQSIIKRHELTFQHKDGSPRWVNMLISSLFNEEGHYAGTLGILTDITKRKRLEEQLKFQAQLLDSVHESIIATDLEGNTIYWGNGATLMYGYSAEEAIGKSIEIILPPEAEKAEKERMRQAHKFGSFSGAYTHKRKDNSFFWVETVISLIKDENGQPSGFISTIRDVTEYKLIEENLKQQIKDLGRAAANHQKFVYIASHDLQQPLFVMLGYLELIREQFQGTVDPECELFLDRITQNAERMHTMINDLLTYSRVETRGQAFKPTNSETVLKKAIAELTDRIEKTNAQITYKHLPTLIIDETQIKMVFQNLIDNAIKFQGNNQDQPEIHVSAVQKEANWQFCVKDNGIGIESKYMGRVFEIFQKAHDLSKIKTPGTGSGLSICKRIIERHNGQIWVESEPGKGS
ncbi:MAG: PAS domain S-box protein, partial [Candidatus Hodarchaeota archaeon]